MVQFPGSNCERETSLAIQRVGMVPIEFLWNDSIDKLLACDGYVIVGGFSYEDRSRAGIIAALDPIIQVLKTQTALGKPLLGICNGAQILIEAGLVPGFASHAVEIALTDNKRIKQGQVLGTGYYNAWINLKLATTQRYSAFIHGLTATSILRMPVAHAEGRFVISKALLARIEAHGLAIFQYCTEAGDIVNEFPVNPNGSVNNIAAIGNVAGNVLAIMPHPERTAVGDVIFHSMREYIAARFGKHAPSTSLAQLPHDSQPAERFDIKPFKKRSDSDELLIELMITDNHALSVEGILKKRGLSVHIQRRIHWEIIYEHSKISDDSSDSLDIIEKIQASGLLYNERKECLIPPSIQLPGQFLVRAKEDLLGRQKQQQLTEQFGIPGIACIQHGILWQISAAPAYLDSVVEEIFKLHILFNPFSHECFVYE